VIRGAAKIPGTKNASGAASHGFYSALLLFASGNIVESSTTRKEEKKKKPPFPIPLPKRPCALLT
jgi:hypothetical protein